MDLSLPFDLFPFRRPATPQGITPSRYSLQSIPSSFQPSPMQSPYRSISTPSLTVSTNSQLNAQTALLLAVLRATPNEVFYTLAKDYFWTTYNNVTSSILNAIQENITYRLPVVNRRFGRGKEDTPSSSSLEDSSDEEDSATDSSWSTWIPSYSIRRKKDPVKHNRTYARVQLRNKRQHSPTTLQRQQEFHLLRSLIRVIIKLYLTLILEVVTIALRFLG